MCGYTWLPHPQEKLLDGFVLTSTLSAVKENLNCRNSIGAESTHKKGGWTYTWRQRFTLFLTVSPQLHHSTAPYDEDSTVSLRCIFKHISKLSMQAWINTFSRSSTRWLQLRTVLSELRGRELRGDPERLLGAALEDEAGGDAGTAVEVFLTAGQPQVEGVVTEGRVLITLRPRGGRRGANNVSTCSQICLNNNIWGIPM